MMGKPDSYRVVYAEIISVKDSAAEVIPIDLAAQKESAQFEEIVPNKLASRLEYSDVYQNTNVVYDLDSNMVKESIVMEQYDSDLHGYRYVLNTGDMIPILTESNDILLYDESREEVIMLMPAPYLIDAAGEISCDIKVVLQDNGSNYILSYLLPINWMSMKERQWPVILDPVVQTIASNSNAEDQTVYQNSSIYTPHTSVVITAGYDSSCRAMRTYLRYTDIPDLTAADVIIYANLNLYMPEKVGNAIPIELHRVTSEWSAGDIRWSSQPSYDTKIEDYALCDRAQNRYSWDITDLVRSWYYEENYGMVLKASDAVENAGVNNWKRFYSANFKTAEQPIVTILFRNNNGLESYWDYTTVSAGRAGNGYVNQYTGNLVWIRNDIGFGGNLSPVSISHVYNANDSTENLFGMGCGWRTNFNQRVYQWDEDDAYGDYYVWEDADGTSHYFLSIGNNTYKDEDGLELTLNIHGTGTSRYYLITDKYGNTSKFDSHGRLVKQELNQAINRDDNENNNFNITIGYISADSLQISEITDGAGRVYSFIYSNNLLSRISYEGKSNDEISYVSFVYENARLIQITDQDGKTSVYTYITNTNENAPNLLVSAADIDGYKLSFEYNSLKKSVPNRISKINETSGAIAGGALNIAYGQNQTSFTDHNGNVQIVQFNNMGNTISIQDDQGRAQYAQYAINNPTNPDDAATAAEATESTGTAKGNQLLLASKLQNTVGNMLADTSFENGTLWGRSHSDRLSREISTTESYLGAKSMAMTHTGDGVESALISLPFLVEPGETYTFSAYVKTGEGNAYLCMSDGSIWPKSEILPAGSGWTRLQVSYKNTGTSTKEVKARFQTSLPGTAFIDCVQVEKASTASRYNLIGNGDFRDETAWSSMSGQTTAETEEIEKPPAAQLDSNIYKMTGNPQSTNRISQTVKVSGTSGDTFVLAGWAKADSVPIFDNREFALIATFKNGNNTVNTSIVRFNHCADSTINWQYAASPIIANGEFDSIVVELAYDYNANTAYFDGIQLYKEEFGSSFTYDEDGNIISIKDLQGKTTTYNFDQNNNLIEEILPSGAKLTYTYDIYHNETGARSSTGVEYAFGYDEYGNNVSVAVKNGNQTITSSAVYSDDKNSLYKTIDAAGNITTYCYDENTNLLMWVQYPGEDSTTRTTYGYEEDTFLLQSVSEAVRKDNIITGTLSVGYEYTNDLLTKITTGSNTVYNFDYGAFSLRTGIRVGGQTLACYIYKDINDTDARFNAAKFNDAPVQSLIGLDYGNGDRVEYTYDKQGKVTQQTYEDGDTVTFEYDNDGALAVVKDSDSGITTTYYYDFIGRLVKVKDGNNEFSRRVEYFYNEKNQLVTKSEFFGDVRHNTYFNYDNDNRQTMVGTSLSQRRYTYDAYGRQNQRKSTYNGTAVLTETFGYDSGNRISTLTKLLVDNGVSSTVTHSYTYDGNGNITSVTVGDESTRYTYDSANQLIREDNPYADKTYVWTYDNAGNITSRKEYAYTDGTLGAVQDTVDYTYGDANWGDLLKAYDGEIIAYDEIGNPTSYYNGTRWTMTWEHGRELRTISNGSTTWTNTYDANGLRTKRTNGTTTYRYRYTDGQLATMNIGDDVEMWFMYDGNGPMVLKYDDGLNQYGNVEFHYELNLQGDVVAIISSRGERVVEYTYDAWGNVIEIKGSAKDTIGVHNPLRYRGYVYDTETQLYYLQSRYYDPAIGRFINADAFASTGQGILGNNMFAYCNNNPITREDESGELWGQVVLGVLTQYGADVLGNYFAGKTGADLFIPTSSITDYATAAITSVIPGSGFGGALVRSVISEGMEWVGNILEGNPSENNFKQSCFKVFINAGADYVLSGILDYFDGVISQSDFATYARNSTTTTSSPLPQINTRMQYSSKLSQILTGTVSTLANIGSSYVMSFIT